MKDILKVVYISFCLSLFLFAGVYYIFVAPKDETFSQSENRKLKGLPAFVPAVAGGTLDSEMEEYLLDNFLQRVNVIKLSHSFKDLASIASYDEYIKIAKGSQDGLNDGINDDDISNIIAQLTLTPAPTKAPTATAFPTSSPTPAPTKMPEATATPTLSPTPAENPPIVAKPDAILEDYPTELSNYMVVDGATTVFASYSRDNVLAYTSVLNKYASVLPENGKLITTLALFSTTANRFVNSSKNGYLKSDPIAFIDAFGRDNVFTVDSCDTLTNAIKSGDYVFYRSDCHWTTYGAYLVYRELIKQAGNEPCNFYDDFTHYYEDPFLGTIYRDYPSEALKNNPDVLELVEPKYTTELRKINGKDSYTVIPFLNWNAAYNDRYTIFLGGPAGPWIYAESDNGKEENCLVIMDSTGLSVFPFLTANYKQVHYYDPRYYDAGVVGYSVSEMIEKYNITDVYVIMLDSHTFNSSIILVNANNQF